MPNPTSSPPVAKPAPLKIFISYAHKDDAHRIALVEHLSPLIDNGTFTLWHDRCLSGGQEWAGQIDTHLAEAQIVLLLLSRHFLASDYCRDVEVAQALAMHRAGQARVVPVVLKSCSWHSSPLGQLQALPRDGVPVVESPFPDQLYLQVIEGLKQVARELNANRRGTELPGKSPAPPAEQPPAQPPQVPTEPPPGRPPELPLRPVPRWRRLLAWCRQRVVGHQRPLAVALALGLGGAAVWLAQWQADWQADIHADLRIDRPDLALDKLAAVPGWLDVPLGLGRLRQVVQLHEESRQMGADSTGLTRKLDELTRQAPQDADLRFIRARRLWLQGVDSEAASRELQAALLSVLQADARYAAAEDMLGLLANREGRLADAALHHEAAWKKAPAVPEYLSNHARSLLDLGQPDRAAELYTQAPPGYALAPAEAALAAWAHGRPGKALDRQNEALQLLGDARVVEQPQNRRDWVFFHLTAGPTPEMAELRLAGPDKRCYVEIERAISQSWSDGQDGSSLTLQTLPASCQQRPPLRDVLQLVGADVCRYIIQAATPATDKAAWAEAVRQRLGQNQPCPPLLQGAAAVQS